MSRDPRGGYSADGDIESLPDPPVGPGIGEQGWTDEELETLSDQARPADRQDLDRPALRVDPGGPDEATFEIIEREMLRDLGRRCRGYARHPSSNAREAVAYLDLAAAIDGVLELDRSV